MTTKKYEFISQKDRFNFVTAINAVLGKNKKELVIAIGESSTGDESEAKVNKFK